MTLLAVCGGRRMKNPLGCGTRHFQSCSVLCTSRARFKMCILKDCRCSAPLAHVKGVLPSRLSFSRYLSNGSTKRNYYDILGITPKATQAQVKKAYYKMSKTYHPDQYKGREDAAVKFREISEAYEVLGNFQKRRMYDKGILTHGLAASPQEAEEYSSRFYESRSKRSRMPSSGRTPIYNFDDWSRNHYEASFARKQSAKNLYEEYQRKKEADVASQKFDTFIWFLIFVIFGMILHSSLRNDADKPSTVKMPPRDT